MKRTIKSISGPSTIDGVVPGVRGQSAFPNRELKSMNPFVMLDHIGEQHVGADYFVDGSDSAHPHRGFETVTFLFEGIMDHKDSLGNQVRLRSGDVQRMNAGSGIQHGGDFRSDPHSQLFHEVQLWVNLPAKEKMSIPGIFNAKVHDIPVYDLEHGKIRVIGGAFEGLEGPIRTIQPTRLLHAISKQNQKMTISEIASDHNMLIYVLKGNIRIEDQEISQHQAISLNNEGDHLDLELLDKSQVLIVSGKPIDEPVVMGGPFVMNTAQEIDQAFEDFQAGKFGAVK
ncbi:pirin family protein [bacterium SCSIO 12643]|nr:pirin family protein [bacterium SCSIO 12643]